MSEKAKGKRQKERPILFSTDMVRAILEGRKIETRRVITSGNTTGFSVKKDLLDFSQIYPNGSFGVKVADKSCQYDRALWRGQCKWQPGDLLYVRETFSIVSAHYRYKADGDWTVEEKEHGEFARWKPSIHMPKQIARIWLKVKNVKAERLQEITTSEIIREGAAPENSMPWEAIDKWCELWDSLNADRGYSWESNPWVWVVQFEVVSTNGNPEADHG